MERMSPYTCWLVVNHCQFLIQTFVKFLADAMFDWIVFMNQIWTKDMHFIYMHGRDGEKWNNKKNIRLKREERKKSHNPFRPHGDERMFWFIFYHLTTLVHETEIFNKNTFHVNRYAVIKIRLHQNCIH